MYKVYIWLQTALKNEVATSVFLSAFFIPYVKLFCSVYLPVMLFLCPLENISFIICCIMHTVFVTTLNVINYFWIYKLF